MNGDPEHAADDPAAAPPDEAQEADDDAPAPRQSQRRQLEKARREELANWNYLNAHDPSEPTEVIFRGVGIGTDGGDAEMIGTAIARFARLFTALVREPPYMENLRFANSVHVLLRPSKKAQERARRELQRAKSVDNEAVAQQILLGAVTDVQVAASLAADLIQASSTEAPRHAAQLGTAVAQAYKSLATSAAREGLTISVHAPDKDESTRLTPAKAGRVAEALRTVTEPQRFTETVVGVLSIADATQKTFGLQFDPGAKKSPTFRRKRLIRGSYTPAVEDLIRERGLWGKRVRARIEVEQDALVSTSTIRPPQFRLLDVEEAAN